jgi:hypothetical protein
VYSVSEAITLQSPSMIDAFEQVADILHPATTPGAGGRR